MAAHPDVGRDRLVERHHGGLAPALGAVLAHRDARHVVVEVGDVHRAQHRERTAVDRRVEDHVEGVQALVGPDHAHARRAAALEGQRESARRGIDRDLLDAHDRPAVILDRADQERGAEGRRRHAVGCLGADAPIAVLRIKDQHLLAAHRADHPHLQQVHVLVDLGADTHGGGRGPPERRLGVGDDPHLDVLVDGLAARRGRHLVHRIGGHVASGPVGLEAVAADGRHVNRVRGLDAKRAHLL